MQRLAALIDAEHGRFILFLPVLMGAGALVYFGLREEPSGLVALGPLGAGLMGLVCAWQWPIPRALALGMVFGLAGFADAWWATARAPPWQELPHGATVLAGRVSVVEALPGGRRVTLATPSVDGEASARDLRIRLRSTDPVPVGVGDIVTMRAMVRAPSPPDVPGGWDTQRDAFFSGVGGYGFAIGPVQLVSAAPRHWWSGLREAIAARIMAALPGARGAVAATLLTGFGTAIPAGDRAAFQDSGLAHLLAVAGLHIGIVMGLACMAVRLGLSACEYTALHWPVRRLSALAALGLGGFYLALTGAHLPILRSFAMGGLFTLGVLTGRRALSLRSLALAALLVLAWSPAAVLGVSFQMSFAAVLALIACAEAAAPAFTRRRPGRWWSTPARYVAGLLLTSLVAGTASLPFAVYHFGRAALYYVPANILAVPLTAFWIMPWGLAALALMPAGLERLALVPMGAGIDGLLGIAHAVAGWPGAAQDLPQVAPAALALVAGGMAWLGLWRTRWRLLGVAPLSLGLAWPCFAVQPDIVVGPEATVIAARVGDAVLVAHARRATPLEVEAPPRMWGAGHATEFPIEGVSAAGAAACDAAGCRLRIRGFSAVLVRNAAALPCGPDVLVSAETLKDVCAGSATADRALVRRAGAVAVRLTGAGPVFVTDRDIRGTRPWVILAEPLLPAAVTE